MLRVLTLLGVCVAVAATCSSAHADLIAGDVLSIDFGETAPVGGSPFVAVASDGDGTINVSDIGGFTGVDLTVTGVDNDTSGQNINGNAAGYLQGPSGPSDSGVFSDGIIAIGEPGNDTITITFSGLDDSLVYSLETGFGRSAGNLGNFESVYTVDGQSQQIADPVGGLLEGTLTFTGLSTDGSQNLVFTSQELDASDRGQFTYVILTATAVPEPSSLGLLGLGMVGLFTRRRR